MDRFAQKSLAGVFMLVLVVSYATGQTNASMMRTSGQVTVNGTPVTNATVLRENDVVAVPAATNASITSVGSSFTLTPRTDFVMLDNAFVLDNGGSKIVTITGFSAKVKAYTVLPRDPK